jgi:hypothetical protein
MNTRRLPYILLALFVALLLVRVSAAVPGRVFFPAVRYPLASTPVVLVSTDTGLVNAVVLSDGRIVVAYANRTQRGLVHVAFDTGGSLTEIPSPMAAAIERAAPGFTLEGEKQGGFSMVQSGGQLVVYFTSRDEGDTTGPFRLRRVAVPIEDL